MMQRLPKISQKLAVATSIFLVGSFMTYLAVTFYYYQHSFYEEIENRFRRAGSLFSENIEEYRKELITEVNLASHLHLLRGQLLHGDLNQEKLRPYFKTLNRPFVEVLDPAGKPLLNFLEYSKQNEEAFVGLIKNTQEKKISTEFFNLNGYFSILAATPILEEGQVVSYLILGQTFDETYFERFSSLTGVSVSLYYQSHLTSPMGLTEKQHLALDSLISAIQNPVGIQNLFESEGFLSQASPIVIQEKRLPNTWLVFQDNLFTLRKQILEFFLVLLVIGIFIVLVILLIQFKWIKKILYPIERMKEVADEIIHTKDVTRRLEESGTDEVASLAKSFNTLLDEVNQYNASAAHSSRLAALGEMSAGICHEINSPLTTIQGYVGIMKICMREDPMDKEKIFNSVDKISSTVMRIAKIIRGLQSYSRDAKNDDFELVNLNTAFGNILAFCSERLNRFGVSLEIKEFDLSLSLMGREAQISQVFLNFLNNASDAVQELAERWIKVEVKADSEWIEIWITDSGPGIPPEIQAKILQPFFTTKPIGKGTGLGLSISKGIIEQHGGTLSIDKECEHTRFVIRFPRVNEVQTEAVS